MKMSDEGVRILFYYPLQQLRELDVSSTEVTVRSLELLPTGRLIETRYFLLYREVVLIWSVLYWEVSLYWDSVMCVCSGTPKMWTLFGT